MHQPPSWLERSVIYQIYPQSFQDSNGDGIGDLPGLEARLDYLQSLGIAALWINPCFDSPFQDAGYDVRDYRQVAPRYGTNEDLRRLCAEAHRRGLRVLLDLVPGHTSNQHPWFVESARATRNRFSDWYIWTNKVWDSTAGMDFVSGYSERYAKYITNFFWFQPALNYGFAEPDPRHPWQLPVDHPACREVRAEMQAIMRHWLELGADGFRVDMAGSLVKGSGEKKHAAMRQLWGEVRTWMDRDFPEAVLISEWGDPPVALDCGFDMDFILPFAPQNGWRALFFEHAHPDWDDPAHELAYFAPEGRGDASAFLRYLAQTLERTRGLGYLSVPSGNHDTAPRLAAGRSLAEQKCLMAFILSLPGVPFLNYGDEIGLRHVAGLVSREGGYNRTAARTPMQWDDSPNAGFSRAAADQLYLPLDPAPDRPTVAAQEADPDSLLHTVRRLIALRTAHRALAGAGDFRVLLGEPNRYPMAFLRSHPEAPERILAVFNPRAEAARTAVEFDFAPAGEPVPLLAQEATASLHGRRLEMALGSSGFGLWALR